MSTIEPPTFSTTLLRRLVPAQDHEVLLGDLAEEYRRGRSTMWYRFQIIAAIAVGAFRDIRTHPLLAVRAVAVGMASLTALIIARLTLQDAATGAGFMWGTTWIGLPFYWHWPYVGSWSVNTFFELLWLTSSLATGWIVARTHRGHGITMVLAFLAGLIAFRALFIPVPIIAFSSRAFARAWIIEGLLILVGGYLATARVQQA